VSSAIPVVICDDSKMARKQMSNALKGWNVEVTYAEHGLEGLEAVRAGKGDILFLDLTMPIMDGYQVLERIRRDDLPTMVIVVSGDIQPEARNKVMSLGALEFIKKPIDGDTISNVLNNYGLLSELEPGQVNERMSDSDIAISLKDYYQEIANVAMGHAADRLARLLNVFVHLPIPKVELMDIEELAMTITGQGTSTSVISQGFISPGIAGEAIILFNDSSYQDIAKLLKFEGELNTTTERELLTDISNVLIGAFLNSLATQLDLTVSQGAPAILGQHCAMPDFISRKQPWKKSLSIEISYNIQDHNIDCDLLLLFTEDSLPALNERASLFT